MLVQRATAERKATSLHDPVLEELRLGAVARTPPVTLLAQRGLLDRLKPYQLVVDTRYESPGRQMVEDVAVGEIDVGVLWGPIAGYWAKRQSVPLEITPLVGEDKGVRLDFRISMGMRRNEPEWKRQINELLAASEDEIQAILMDYGVPLLDEQGQPISDAPANTKDHGALEPVAEPDGYRISEYRAPVPASLAGATVLTTADLQALLETARPILLDVLPTPREPPNRPAGSVWRPPAREHLPGSAWLPNVGYGELSDEFERYFRDNLARLTGDDRSRPLVFYCQADCWMSWNAAKRALAYGYQNVAWYPEGTDGWRAAGLPLVPGEPVPMPEFVPLPDSAAASAARAD